MSEIGERLRKARLAAGYRSAAKAASRLGVKTSTYAAHENGQNEFDGPTARRYAKLFNVSAGWLLAGEGDEPGEAREMPDFPAEPPSELIDVPEMEIRTGGGSFGFEGTAREAMLGKVSISADAIKDHWGLPASFLRGEMRMRRGSAFIVEVFGDSMYDPANPGAPGSLFPNDRVIVDIFDRLPSPPGPFLVWDGLGLVVKLVEVSPDKPDRLRLSSRNPIYKPRDVTEDEAFVIGRVKTRISAM